MQVGVRLIISSRLNKLKDSLYFLTMRRDIRNFHKSCLITKYITKQYPKTWVPEVKDVLLEEISRQELQINIWPFVTELYKDLKFHVTRNFKTFSADQTSDYYFLNDKNKKHQNKETGNNKRDSFFLHSIWMFKSFIDGFIYRALIIPFIVIFLLVNTFTLLKYLLIAWHPRFLKMRSKKLWFQSYLSTIWRLELHLLLLRVT